MDESLIPIFNTTAIRCFRNVADNDYIAARLCHRSQLIPQFLWSGLQAIEKYLKCILLLNRIHAKTGHSLEKALQQISLIGKFEVRMSEETKAFIKYLDGLGADRYLSWSNYTKGGDLPRLDRAVWEIRRYARVMQYKMPGLDVDPLSLEVEVNTRAEEKHPHDFKISGGRLESIIAKANHPARAALIWNNGYFGTNHRKTIRVHGGMSFENSPLSLNPEILDEFLKYAQLPKDMEVAYRELLKTKQKNKETLDER